MIAFNDARDLFIHGVIDRRRETCVSLPVLYMAIGHRLGWPIRAATVPKHMFCRWEDPAPGERFNMEASGVGTQRRGRARVLKRAPLEIGVQKGPTSPAEMDPPDVV